MKSKSPRISEKQVAVTVGGADVTMNPFPVDENCTRKSDIFRYAFSKSRLIGPPSSDDEISLVFLISERLEYWRTVCQSLLCPSPRSESGARSLRPSCSSIMTNARGWIVNNLRMNAPGTSPQCSPQLFEMVLKHAPC